MSIYSLILLTIAAGAIIILCMSKLMLYCEDKDAKPYDPEDVEYMP